MVSLCPRTCGFLRPPQPELESGRRRDSGALPTVSLICLLQKAEISRRVLRYPGTENRPSHVRSGSRVVTERRTFPGWEANGSGHPQAAAELLPLVYEDLRRLAVHRLARLSPGQTLQPTALVHEAWLRMAAEAQRDWAGPEHFFGAAAEVMRRVLVDHVRRRTRLKRGGGQVRLGLEELDLAGASPDEKVLLIEEALQLLEAQHPEKAKIVVLKFFGGLTDREAARHLGVTERTVERHWAFARAWLVRALGQDL